MGDVEDAAGSTAGLVLFCRPGELLRHIPAMLRAHPGAPSAVQGIDGRFVHVQRMPCPLTLDKELEKPLEAKEQLDSKASFQYA